MWDTVSVMAKLSTSTVTINDGDILLYKRARSSAWQAKFKIGSRWVRTTTKLDDLDKAKRAAKDLFTEYQFKQKHDVPVITRRFADVARYVIADMRTTPAALARDSNRPHGPHIMGPRGCQPAGRCVAVGEGY